MVRRLYPSLFILLSFVILFSTCYTLYAQDTDLRANADADGLPVLEPQDVLTDNVAVIETLPELNGDIVNNVLYFLEPNSDNWEMLSPPNAISGYVSTDRLQNGNFRVYEMPSDMAGPCPPATPSFEFDPATRHFTQQAEEIDTPDSGSYWGLFYPNPPENIGLRNYCELDTYGAELPDDISDLIRASIEHDGHYDGPYPTEMHIPNYLIVAAPLPDDAGNYLFAVYTVDDGNWSDSIPLTLTGDWAFRSLGYQGDVLYIEARGETGVIFYRLDVARKAFKKLFQTPYPQSAFSGQNNVYYYMSHNDTDYQFYRYDLFSEREEIIAALPCAAFTDHCIELSIRDSNRWSHITELMFVVEGAKAADGIPYFVVDIPNASVLHKGLLPPTTTSLLWLDTKPSLLISVYRDVPEPYAVLVDLSGDNPAETQIVIPYRIADISPNEQSAVVYVADIEANTQTIGIVDLQTLAYRPITLPLDTSVFDVGIFWRTDATLEITIYAHDYDSRWFDSLPLRTWVIQPE
ncbi:MAG: hypothetical protein ABI690_05295 [Chloroflexota bacterium]